MTVASLWTESVVVFFLGSALSGFGFGTSFQAAMKTLGASTLPHQRGRVFASVFVVSYTAFSVPALAAGFAVGPVGLLRTAEVYAGTVAVFAMLAAAAAFALNLSRRSPAVVEPACAIPA